MSFDAQAIFANLAEKERIKGHHSPEGRAIRTLSRALSGWSSGKSVRSRCRGAVRSSGRGLAESTIETFAVVDQTVPALVPLRSTIIGLRKRTPIDCLICTIRAHAPIGPGQISTQEVETALSFASS